MQPGGFDAFYPLNKVLPLAIPNTRRITIREIQTTILATLRFAPHIDAKSDVGRRVGGSSFVPCLPAAGLFTGIPRFDRILRLA